MFAGHRGVPDDYFSVVYAKTMRMLTTEPETDLTFATAAAGSAAAVQDPTPLRAVGDYEGLVASTSELTESLGATSLLDDGAAPGLDHSNSCQSSGERRAQPLAELRKALDGLVAEHETNVPGCHRLAPGGHRRRGHPLREQPT